MLSVSIQWIFTLQQRNMNNRKVSPCVTSACQCRTWNVFLKCAAVIIFHLKIQDGRRHHLANRKIAVSYDDAERVSEARPVHWVHQPFAVLDF